MSNYFDNERVMYIPLSIDNVDTSRGNYFFSSMKIIQMTIGLIPYFFLLFPLMQGAVRLVPILIITVAYLFVYSFFFRYVILEEAKLRRMLRELDNNKVSGIDYFWQNNKIGDKGLDKGVIHYERSGDFTERGLVVTYNRGSLIAVPPSAYTEYRQTKMAFMRELAIHNYDFTWYEIPVKETEVPDSLLHYFNKMTLLDNSVYKQLIKLQLDINVSYTMGEGINYRDFILIRNKNFKTLRRFREITQDIIDITLANNIYIVNPQILDKRGVEKFFANVLMLNNVDSDSVRKGAYYKPFSSYAEVVRVVDAKGADIPLEFIDNMDFGGKEKDRSIEDMLAQNERLIKADIAKLDKQRKIAITTITGQRNRNVITDKVYRQQIADINKKFDGLIHEVRTKNVRADDLIKQLRQEEQALRDAERRKKEQGNKTTKSSAKNAVPFDAEADVAVTIQRTSREKAEQLQDMEKVTRIDSEIQEELTELSLEELISLNTTKEKISQKIEHREEKFASQLHEEVYIDMEGIEDILNDNEYTPPKSKDTRRKRTKNSQHSDDNDDDISLEDLL